MAQTTQPRKRKSGKRLFTADTGSSRTTLVASPTQTVPGTTGNKQDLLAQAERIRQEREKYKNPLTGLEEPQTETPKRTGIMGGGIPTRMEPSESWAEFLTNRLQGSPERYNKMSQQERSRLQDEYTLNARQQRISQSPSGRYEAPSLYLQKEGKTALDEKGRPILNEVYNTSKFQDAMAGVQIGTQVAGQSQDAFFRLGAVAGGAIAGLFAKNVAGYQLYRQAQAMADEETKKSMALTEAQAKIDYTYGKIESAQVEMERKKRKDALIADKEQDADDTRSIAASKELLGVYTNEKNEAEVTNTKRNILFRLARIQDKKTTFDKFADMDVSGIDTNSLLDWDMPKKMGNRWVVTSKQLPGVAMAVLGDDGKPITVMTQDDYIKTAKNIASTKEFDEAKARQAFDDARKFYDNLDGFRKQASNAQYTAAITKLADSIYEKRVLGGVMKGLEVIMPFDGKPMDISDKFDEAGRLVVEPGKQADKMSVQPLKIGNITIPAASRSVTTRDIATGNSSLPVVKAGTEIIPLNGTDFTKPENGNLVEQLNKQYSKGGIVEPGPNTLKAYPELAGYILFGEYRPNTKRAVWFLIKK